MPVDGEQHGAEHDAVVAVKLMTNGRYQVLGGPRRVVVTPGRDGSSRPYQVFRVIFPEPHGWPSEPMPNSAVGFMASASLLPRANVPDPVHR